MKIDCLAEFYCYFSDESLIILQSFDKAVVSIKDNIF